MTVRGIGTDLVHVGQLREQLADAASVFEEMTFTPAERAAARSRASRDPARHLAGRYAAKEAFIKAWGNARFGQAPALQALDMRDIEVIQDAHGRSGLRLHGAADAAFQQTLINGSIQLSLSHDGDYAIAFVVIEQAGDTP
jgi:holo-[acyl-carrier protein] synthase